MVQNRNPSFTVTFEFTGTSGKFTIDPPLPVVRRRPGEYVATNFRSGAGTWNSIALTNFRVVEEGEHDPDRGEGDLTFDRNGQISTLDFPTFSQPHRFVAFTVVFTSDEPPRVVTIDPIFIDNPGARN